MAIINSELMRVCVVGAGVVGLSTALHLSERFTGKLDLTIIADKFSPHIVSDMASGIFLYSDLGIKTEKVLADSKRWLSTSLERIRYIFSSTENAQVGIALSHGYIFWSSPQADPWWKELVYGFRHVELESTEARTLSIPPDVAEIWACSTYTMNPTPYLEWLMEKAKEGGCTVENTKIFSLDELALTYDIVINCTGLNSSKELVADPDLYPIRGQAVVAKAPWLMHWLCHWRTDGLSYIIPRASDVVLGGTAEVGNWDESTDESVISDIVERCQELVPSLAGAVSVRSFAGLRPGRDAVRLEGGENSNGQLLIHCYGHGGKGFVLSWGCAVDIGDMVEQKILSRQR